jgi:hypothetical protein
MTAFTTPTQPFMKLRAIINEPCMRGHALALLPNHRHERLPLPK